MRTNIIAFAAAIAIGSLIGSLAPAEAGLFTDVVKSVNNKVQNRLENGGNRPVTPSPQQQSSGKSQWGWLGNKPYLDCLKTAEVFSGWDGGYKKFTGAEKERRYDQGRRECNMKYYGHQ